MRFRLSSTLKRPKTPMETETFKNSFKSGDLWQRIILKTLRFQYRQVKKQWRKKCYITSIPVQIGASIHLVMLTDVLTS